MDLLAHRDILDEISEIKRLSQRTAFKEELSNFFWLKAYQGPKGGLNLYDASTEKPLRKNENREEYYITNVVFQGGGVLGIAHAGFIAGMENAGFRFLGVAGASAGAIIAAGIVAERGVDILKPTHPGITKELTAAPMDNFIDGSYRVRHLIKQLLLKRSVFNIFKFTNWLALIRAIVKKRGLNSGDVFQNWMTDYLGRNNIKTTDDLRNTLQRLKGRIKRAGNGIKSKNIHLPGNPFELFSIIAAAMPIGRKFNFPKDAKLLHNRYNSESPAVFVRASMSIPIFFEPLKLMTDDIEWRKAAHEEMRNILPEKQLVEVGDISELQFLDGGMFSNFPSDSFEDSMPEIPTVGVPMVQGHHKSQSTKGEISRLLSDVMNVADAVRLQRDRETLKKYSSRTQNSYRFALCTIDTGDHNWLNFVMNDNEKIDLFLLGLKRANRFLQEKESMDGGQGG